GNAHPRGGFSRDFAAGYRHVSSTMVLFVVSVGVRSGGFVVAVEWGVDDQRVFGVGGDAVERDPRRTGHQQGVTAASFEQPLLLAVGEPERLGNLGDGLWRLPHADLG